MLKQVKETFDRYTFLTIKDFMQVAQICKISFYKKHEHILLAGDKNYNCYTVIKGLVRHYDLNEEGVDKTLRFAYEKQPLGSLETIFNGTESTEYIEALEYTIVLKFDIRQFEILASNNLRLIKAQNILLKELIAENITHIKFLNILTPEERYVSFRNKYPKLENRAKQKYIASYLGVTPTSFSRIKSRII